MTAPDHHLTDAEARRRIREHLDQTLFVEASAGTGKTAALVERYGQRFRLQDLEGLRPLPSGILSVPRLVVERVIPEAQ